MKRLTLLAIGTFLISLGSGCCCHHGGGACNPCGPCGPAGCGVTPGYPAAYNGGGIIQASASQTSGVTVAQAPVVANYQTAMYQPLSTY